MMASGGGGKMPSRTHGYAPGKPYDRSKVYKIFLTWVYLRRGYAEMTNVYYAEMDAGAFWHLPQTYVTDVLSEVPQGSVLGPLFLRRD